MKNTHKQFMSIVTVDGTVYYLIIDHDKEGENVYFLSPVTDKDLEHLAQKTEQTEDVTSSYPEYLGENSESDTQFVESKPETDDTSSDTAPEADTTEPTQKKSSVGSIVLIVIAVIAIAGAGYYFKIYKPKKELEASDDLDDFQFAEDEDDFVFDTEDEPIDFDEEKEE